MPTSTITVDGQAVTLVPWVSSPAPKLVETWINDSVAAITFPFTGQTQRQGSSGADLSGMTLTYAPLTLAQALPLRAWLMQMRGIARATQMRPPEYTGPRGSCAGTPVLNGAQVAAATQIATKGWPPSAPLLLYPGDLVQIGYRLYTCLELVAADSFGNATFEIFPSLREDVADGTALVTANPKGLYGLAQNRRQWSHRLANLTDMSIMLVEYR